MDTQWANSYNETNNSWPEFQFPDWGFIQRRYSETELREEEASSSRVRERPQLKTHLVYLKLSAKRLSLSKNSAKKTKTINIKF